MQREGFSKRDLVTRFVICLLWLQSICAEVSYSVPEEMEIGTVIGNIAKDLGLDITTLSARKARIDSDGNTERYCVISLKTGDLSIAERFDRESLCGTKQSCVLGLELVLENPITESYFLANISFVTTKQIQELCRFTYTFCQGMFCAFVFILT
uniref:Cadherin N-terminal domain-containing protein n=1 Tax=Mola mola TaxID=94237 RepID=A0A3Q3VTL3_MOLML